MLQYTVEEPIATVLNPDAQMAYLKLFRLLWALKRTEHGLAAGWAELNGLQRQLAHLPALLRQSGLRSHGAASFGMDQETSLEFL